MSCSAAAGNLPAAEEPKAAGGTLLESEGNSSKPGRRGRLALVGLISTVSAVSCLISFRFKGVPGLGGALAGLVMGGAIAGVGHVLRRRAEHAQGHRMVSAMMAATFSSFVLFILLALLIAVSFPDASRPVLLSALGIYLTCSFYQAFLFSGEGRS